MKLYFVDGEISEDLIEFTRHQLGNDMVVVDAKIGYMPSLEKINDVFFVNSRCRVLTNCVHLLNHAGIWEEINKSINPEVYIYNEKIHGYRKASDYKKIRKTNNIETMYRNGDFRC